MTLDRTKLADLSESFQNKKIVVLGDLMLDHFIWGSVSRISPEAPVPVVKVNRESFHLGGAGNVANNLASLGAIPAPVGILGEDLSARRVIQELKGLRADTAGLVQLPGWSTTEKTRIVAHAQQVVRFDREEEEPPDDF